MERKDDIYPMSWRTRFRCARVVLNYVIFTVGGSFISLCIMLMRPLPEKVRLSYACRLLHHGWRLLCFCMHQTRNINVQIQNKERLKDLRSCVIVANHPSLIDIVILTASIPNCMMLAKAQLLRWPFLRPILRTVCLCSDIDPQIMMAQADKALHEGYNLIIFPEGTRTTIGKEGAWKRGAFQIAAHCQVPVLPIRLDLNQPFLCKETPWWYAGRTCTRYDITVHEVVTPQSLGLPEDVSYHKAAEGMRRYTQELLMGKRQG